MSVYSTGSVIVSSIITTKLTTGDPTFTAVSVGDTLSDVKLAPVCNCPAEACAETITSATVKGFILKNKETRRGACQVIDNVPTHLYDEEGYHYGTADEVLAVDSILVEIPAEEEGGTPTTRTIRVSRIMELTATPAADDSEKDPVTPPTEGDTEGL